MKLYVLSLIILLSCAGAGVENSAAVSSMSGIVLLNGQPVKLQTQVKNGDTIETGDKSFCIIRINSKSVIRLGKNTFFIYRISDTENTFELRKGWLSGLTRKKFVKSESYNISTPTGTAAVRGTSYCIVAESPESSYFCVCNGTVTVKGETEETVKAAHHEARRFIRSADGTVKSEKNAPMLYHTDDDIEKLAEAVGEKIDWSSAD